MNVAVSSIRVAAPHERTALEALQTRASLANPSDRGVVLAHPDLNQVPASQLESGRVFAAEQNGTLVGFAVILPRSDGDAELDGLFVDPERWRQGIGSRLIEHCEQVARSQGCAALHVVANPHAAGFYARCGFSRVGSAQLRFGIGLLFRKVLL